MVYGRILYNNIKEYTPKWMKTVPYAQTAKPTFSNDESYLARQPQVQSVWSSRPGVKKFWLFVGRNVQRSPWMWQMVIFFFAYGWFHLVYDPVLWIYRTNNKHVNECVMQRTLEYALTKEREFKRKQQEKENAEESKASESEE